MKRSPERTFQKTADPCSGIDRNKIHNFPKFVYFHDPRTIRIGYEIVTLAILHHALVRFSLKIPTSRANELAIPENPLRLLLSGLKVINRQPTPFPDFRFAPLSIWFPSDIGKNMIFLIPSGELNLPAPVPTGIRPVKRSIRPPTPISFSAIVVPDRKFSMKQVVQVENFLLFRPTRIPFHPQAFSPTIQ